MTQPDLTTAAPSSAAEDGEVAELRKRVQNPNDLVMFDEAAACLRGGAHRSGYIVTWICVAESLKQKFVDLSQRDAEAGKVVADIRKAEASNGATDELILQQARQLSLVDNAEHKKLEHMRAMRNEYAHPTGSAPAAREVVNALHVAVEAVLGRPALLRQGAAKEFVRSVFEEPNFLPHDDERVAEIAVAMASSLQPAALPFFLDELLKRLEAMPPSLLPTVRALKERALVVGRAALESLRPDLAVAPWNAVGMLQKYPAAAPRLLGYPELWPLLPEHARDIALNHLLEPTAGVGPAPTGGPRPPTPGSFRMAWTLYVQGVLEPHQRLAVERAIRRVAYSTLQDVGVRLPYYAGRIIDDLKSRNWYTQNPAAGAMRSVKDGLDELDDGVLEQLGRNVLQAADGSSDGAISLIRVVAADERPWPKAFVEGLLLECLVNDERRLRLKRPFLKEVLAIAARHPAFEQLFEQLRAQLRASQPKNLAVVGRELAAARAALEDVISSHQDANPNVDRALDLLHREIVSLEQRFAPDESDGSAGTVPV